MGNTSESKQEHNPPVWIKSSGTKNPVKGRVLTRATSASVKNAVQMNAVNQQNYEISGVQQPFLKKQNTTQDERIELGYQKQMNNLFKVVSKPDLAN